MVRTSDALEALLATETYSELVVAAQSWPSSMSLPEAGRLNEHLRRLNTPGGTLRIAFARTVTSELLDPWLDLHAGVQGFDASVYHAPFGLGPMESKAGSGLSNHSPDVTIVLLGREDLHPELSRPGFVPPAPEAGDLNRGILDRTEAILDRYRKIVDGQLLLAVVPPVNGPATGLYDAHADTSEQRWWSQVKGDIAAMMRASIPASLFLDLDEVMAHTGRLRFFDLRYWYTSRYPFAAAAAQEFARRIVAIGTVARTPRIKVIVLDADNTLWGGVIGEDGMNGIELSPDYPGNAFIEFQRRLLDYQQRGFLLAMCSKNNPEDVDEVLEKHPHQVLRKEHFVAMRVNWSPKSENLRSVAEELNLGLDSFLFVDDSDHECELVRRELPMVTVLKTPARAVDIPRCLEHVARLEVLSLTDEDRDKTRMYSEERRRKELKESVATGSGDIQEYLASLHMQMTVHVNDAAGLKRLAQMTQKTNQFNLTTRRYDEQKMREYIEAEDHAVTSFSMADIFGDSGVVGLAIARQVSESEAELDTFLMSCRVIGRQAESAFLAATLDILRQRGVTSVKAQYLPTRKNRLVKDFLPEHGFTDVGEGTYLRDLTAAPPASATSFPIEITVHA